MGKPTWTTLKRRRSLKNILKLLFILLLLTGYNTCLYWLIESEGIPKKIELGFCMISIQLSAIFFVWYFVKRR